MCKCVLITRPLARFSFTCTLCRPLGVERVAVAVPSAVSSGPSWSPTCRVNFIKLLVIYEIDNTGKLMVHLRMTSPASLWLSHCSALWRSLAAPVLVKSTCLSGSDLFGVRIFGTVFKAAAFKISPILSLDLGHLERSPD